MLRVYRLVQGFATLCDICKWRFKKNPEDALHGPAEQQCKICGVGVQS